jgi:cysteine desulfurase/selenocysteine lyase
MMKRDWQTIRDDFPALRQEVHGQPLVYLDNAATSQKPRAVLDAIARYYERDNANVHRGIHELSNRATAGYENARKRAAQFVNAESASSVVFTRGTTEGINLVANAWGERFVGAGDRIVLTEMEHHSNLVPWQQLAKRKGAQLVFLPVVGDEGVLDAGRIDEVFSGPIRLFAITHISNSLGTRNPVEELCARAKAAGAVTLVDAAQSAGHCPVDVRAIGCDFLAFSGHKICGPTGIGVLYGRPELLDAMTPYQMGGEMISSVDFYETRWNVIPHKFEAGTPNIEGAVGLHAAMDYLDAVGRDRIFERDGELARYAYDRLAALGGVRLFGPKAERGGVVSFVLPGVHAHDVVTMADQFGVALRGGHHCTQPLMKRLGVPSTARASVYFYNTREEIDRMIDALAEIVRFFNREL